MAATAGRPQHEPGAAHPRPRRPAWRAFDDTGGPMRRLRSGTQRALALASRRRARTRVRSSGRRLVARVLVVAVIAAQGAVALAVPAGAAAPTALGVSGWQVFSSLATFANPSPGISIHG